MNNNFTDAYNNAQNDRYTIVYPEYMNHIALNDRAENDTENTNLFYFTVDEKYANHLYARLTALGADILNIKEAEIAIETSTDYQILAATIGIVEDGSVTDLDDINGDFDLLKALIKREVEKENGNIITNEDAILSVLDEDTKKRYNLAVAHDEYERD